MEDFNIPSAERVALLKRLQEAIGDVPPYFWAACQVCDLKALEKWVEVARISPTIVRVATLQSRTMAHYWSTHPAKGLSQLLTTKKTTPSDLGSSPAISAQPSKKRKTFDSPGGGKVASSPPLSRNMLARDAAEQRDNFRCVLTGDAVIEVAHIYPFHSIKHREEDMFGQRHVFWDHLKNFWPEEKVAAWEAELFPRGIDEMGLDRAYNLITLSRNAHESWDRGAFALKPISVSNDKTTLKIQFFWQKKQNDTQATTMSLLTTPFSTKDLDRNEGAYDHGITRFVNVYTLEPIKSGQFFELQTDDAIQRPLPSLQLLEMQWFLQRVAGMAGAAGDLDWEDWDEDSDEEIPNLELDEVGDTSFVSIDPNLPASPQFLRKDNVHLAEGSKHHMEEAEGDGVKKGAGDRDGDGDGDGVRVIV